MDSEYQVELAKQIALNPPPPNPVQQPEKKSWGKEKNSAKKSQKKMPLNEWVSQGIPHDTQSERENSDIQNSPSKKKFKFSPSAANNESNIFSKFAAPKDTNETAETVQPVKVIPKRKGFTAPKQKPNFYGDDDSDEDFQ